MIIVNIDKAKQIAHLYRRNFRDKEFEPFDKIIALQIPGSALVQAEIEREKIRLKYQKMQNDIESAESTDEIKRILGI